MKLISCQLFKMFPNFVRGIEDKYHKKQIIFKPGTHIYVPGFYINIERGLKMSDEKIKEEIKYLNVPKRNETSHPCYGCVWYARDSYKLFCPFQHCVRNKKNSKCK